MTRPVGILKAAAAIALVICIGGALVAVVNCTRRPDRPHPALEAKWRRVVEVRSWYVDPKDVLIANNSDPLFVEALSLLRQTLNSPQPHIEADWLDQKMPAMVEFVDTSGSVQFAAAVCQPYVSLDGWTFTSEQWGALANKFSDVISRRIYFYPGGAKRAEGLHDRGRKHGPWKYFHENGKHWAVGEYERGQMVGEWSFWDLEGRPLSADSAKERGLLPP